jgi:hypothetical protein
MIRTARMTLPALLLALALPAARAQAPQPDNNNDDTRYSFHRAEDGYLRLDGRTGQVSACTRRPVGWICQTVPDERAALESEITRLQTENAALKRDLLSNHLPLPNGIRPEAPPARVEAPRVQRPVGQEFRRVVTFIELVWRRLVQMIVGMQRDLLRQS